MNITQNQINTQTNNNIYKNIYSNKINNSNIQPEDTVEITEKSEVVINTKKAYDAFKDTCSDFGYTKNNLGIECDMSVDYVTALGMMESKGLPITSFMINETSVSNTENKTFLPFINKLKEFAENINKTTPGFFSDKFFEFCDAYKEKLIQYGCK